MSQPCNFGTDCFAIWMYDCFYCLMSDLFSHLKVVCGQSFWIFRTTVFSEPYFHSKGHSRLRNFLVCPQNWTGASFRWIFSIALRITTRNRQQNIMAAIVAGKLGREKNGRFGKAWLGKRGGNFWQGGKRKLSETVEIVESAKTPVLVFLKCEFSVTSRRVVELDLLAKELDGGC